ncbi:MAG TPA: type II CAAX endopeptidase family protein [Candidatus Udaeobacter sp.]|jgi:membrane protease YdiL (CAAX protease family)|nr:type II CAAX endopeptidase family protein [Candidatus Udaeobacter sp.]
MFLNAVAPSLLARQSEAKSLFALKCAETSVQGSTAYVPYDSLFAAFRAVPSIAAGLLSAAYLIAGMAVYLSLIYQISTRTRSASRDETPARAFGFPEAILATLLTLFLLLTLSSTISPPSIQFSARNLLANFLFAAFIVLIIVTLLQFRGFDVGELAGFFRISFFRVLTTGAILLFLAYPLIALSETINQRLFGGGSSKQSIVEFFSGSRTIEERIMIIVFAVAIAPVFEEFLFRFFIYGVLKRYFGSLIGVILSAVLFSAAHAHFPSFVPLFVLGICFAIAYEWSGSILVSMTMHSLFNSLTLTALAFPELFPQ